MTDEERFEKYKMLIKIKELKEEITELKVHCKAVDDVNEKMKCCGNCKYRIKKNIEGKIWIELCEKSYIKNICEDWELAE